MGVTSTATIDPRNDFLLLIAGSRVLDDYNLVAKELDKIIEGRGLDKEYNIVVVEGEARGVDLIAKRYAQAHGWRVIPFPANWNQHGKRAGFLRNEQMHKFIAQAPNRLCICFKAHEATGLGTTHSIELGARHHTDVIWNEVYSDGSIETKFYNNQVAEQVAW